MWQQLAIRSMKCVSQGCPPRVCTALLRTWFNGWITSRRLQGAGCCVLACGGVIQLNIMPVVGSLVLSFLPLSPLPRVLALLKVFSAFALSRRRYVSSMPWHYMHATDCTVPFAMVLVALLIRAVRYGRSSKRPLHILAIRPPERINVSLSSFLLLCVAVGHSSATLSIFVCLSWYSVRSSDSLSVQLAGHTVVCGVLFCVFSAFLSMALPLEWPTRSSWWLGGSSFSNLWSLVAWWHSAAWVLGFGGWACK